MSQMRKFLKNMLDATIVKQVQNSENIKLCLLESH